MKKNNNFQITVILLSIFIIIMSLSGCQEQYNTNQFSDITLDSKVVRLVDASLSFNKEYEYVNETDEYPTEVIKSIDIKYLFQNIAKKDISVSVQAYLYDVNNNLIAVCPEDSHRVVHLFKDSTERTYTPANIITYDKPNVTMVDHVKITVTEIT